MESQHDNLFFFSIFLFNISHIQVGLISDWSSLPSRRPLLHFSDKPGESNWHRQCPCLRLGVQECSVTYVFIYIYIYNLQPCILGKQEILDLSMSGLLWTLIPALSGASGICIKRLMFCNIEEMCAACCTNSGFKYSSQKVVFRQSSTSLFLLNLSSDTISQNKYQLVMQFLKIFSFLSSH